jgi:hypothetical protein
MRSTVMRGITHFVGLCAAAATLTGACGGGSSSGGGPTQANGDDAGSVAPVDAATGGPSDATRGEGAASEAGCAPNAPLVDAGAGPISVVYPDPVYARVGALAARVHTACVDTSALASHTSLDALAPSLLAEAGVKSAGAGACSCDWSLSFAAQPPALSTDAQKAWQQAGTNPERYALVSATSAGRPQTILYAASERGALYALRAALGLAVKDAADATARDVADATIVDYPAIAWRGIVEGMYGNRTSYGTQWTPGERALVMRLLGRLRANTFVYGPKDDPYAGWIGGSWRTPYPTSSGAAQAMQVAAHDAAANLMRFVWAISPGAQFDWSNYAGDLAAIESKYDSMRTMGVQHFAIFFDDQNIAASIAQQAQLMNDLDDYVKKKDATDHLLVVWWDYQGVKDSNTDALGPLVHPDVEIMWTGPCVESCTITAANMNPVDTSFVRKASIWDNWPSNGCCGGSTTERMTGRSADLPSAITAYYVNPVINECGPQCGSAVHVSDFLAHLGPVADYAWDAARYAASTAAIDASYARWGPLLAAWQPLVQRCNAAHCTASGPVWPGWTCDSAKTGIWFCDGMNSNCVTELPCPGGCSLQANPNPDICN